MRQGDPLSPYLFVLCMEKLSQIIQAAVNDGIWKPISVGEVELSHLFFVDDLVLFVEASPSQAMAIKHCLDTFCTISGEMMNNSKSNMIFSKFLDMNRPGMQSVRW